MIVFERMVSYANSQNLPLQPIEKRQELGKRIAAAYHADGTKKPLRRIPYKEGGINYQVLNYPPEFREEMDAIISNFYKENPVEPKKERKRFSVKRPVASSKPISR